MDHLRYSSFNLGFRVIQFLTPFMVVGSCTKILVSWIITQISHDVARVLLYFLTNEVSCTKTLQQYSYFHNCASSNNASIPKGISTEYADANPPENGFLPHHNHVHSRNEANGHGAQNKSNTPHFDNSVIGLVYVEDGTSVNDGGNNDEDGQDNGNDGGGDRLEVVIERRTFEGVLIETILTHMCALDYHGWDEFAGAIFNFRRQRYNLLHLPQVALTDPLLCWPGSFPLYGHWNGTVYTFWNWDNIEWGTINDQLNVIVLRELPTENEGANNEEGANGAQNDVEGANHVAHNGGVDANHVAHNGGVDANHVAQNGGVDANHVAQNGGVGANANPAHTEGEGEGSNNGAQIEGEGNMAAQTEGGGDIGAQNEGEGDNAEQTEGGGIERGANDQNKAANDRGKRKFSDVD